MLAMILMTAAFGLMLSHPAPRLDLHEDETAGPARRGRSTRQRHAEEAVSDEWRRLTYRMF